MLIVFRNTKTNGYALSLNSGSGTNLTFDANGNMTSDGNGNSYSWDCENRLLSIVYPGSGNYSAFAYDGLGRNVKIQEYTSSSLTSTRQFVWCDNERCEARDASSLITVQLFALGETITATKYLYAKDHLGSVREMTNNSGSVEAEYVYDPFGRITKVEEIIASDIAFDPYYVHARSGLLMATHRTYNTSLGRWTSRDPLPQVDVFNPYLYVQNIPVNLVDTTGLKPGDCFSTKGAAALDALAYINPQSIRQNQEYCGYVYLASPGCYKASEPVPGNGENCQYKCPKDRAPVADYHTHGDYSDENGHRTDKQHDAWDSDHFSPIDYDKHQQGPVGYPWYLGTPGNGYWVDLPGTPYGTQGPLAPPAQK